MTFDAFAVTVRVFRSAFLRPLCGVCLLLLLAIALSKSANAQTFDNYGPGSCEQSGSGTNFYYFCSAFGLADENSFYAELDSSSRLSGCSAGSGYADAGASASYITGSASISWSGVFGYAIEYIYADETYYYFMDPSSTAYVGGLSVSIDCF